MAEAFARETRQPPLPLLYAGRGQGPQNGWRHIEDPQSRPLSEAQRRGRPAEARGSRFGISEGTSPRRLRHHPDLCPDGQGRAADKAALEVHRLPPTQVARPATGHNSRNREPAPAKIRIGKGRPPNHADCPSRYNRGGYAIQGRDPVFLSRIQIQNFRNFHDLDVRLGRTTVVVGENNVGKSNLLFALRLILTPGLPIPQDRCTKMTSGTVSTNPLRTRRP